MVGSDETSLNGTSNRARDSATRERVMSDAAKIVKKKDHRNSCSTKRDLFTLTLDQHSAGPRERLRLCGPLPCRALPQRREFVRRAAQPKPRLRSPTLRYCRRK